MYIPDDGDLFKKLDNDRTWIVEPKINGIRAIAFGMELFSRHGRKILKPLVERAWFSPGSEFDCEYVCKNGVHRLYIFDIMRYDGKDISELPLIERKKILLKLKIPVVLPWLTDDKIKYYRECIENGYEGVVLKKLDSRYEKFPTESKEISTWLKVKPKRVSFKGRYVL